jgi:hypothetical protein
MRTGRWWLGASLGLALLLAGAGLRAQEQLQLPSQSGGSEQLVMPSRSGLPAATRTTLPRVEEGGTEMHESMAGHHGGEEAEGGEEHGEGGLFGVFDFLLVRPRHRPDDFAIVDHTSGAFVGGDVAHFDWDTEGGYRVGLGWKLANGLEFDGLYTYVHSKDDQNLTRPAGGQLFATLSAPITFDSAGSAVGSSNLDLDIVDLELARRWSPCDDLNLRFVAGARIADIVQKTNVAYDFTASGLGVSNVNDHIRFDGIGLRLGSEAWWKVRGNWGVYGKAFASLMSGEFKTNYTQFVQGGGVAVVDVRDDFEKVIPVSELGFGLGWQGEHMCFRVGYELQNFFGLVDRIDFNDSSSFKPSWRTGDLSLEALTLTVGFAY